jgi:hypothetical protein
MNLVGQAFARHALGLERAACWLTGFQLEHRE